MTNLTDETLMAFADGELDEQEAEAVRIAVDNDGALRARLEELRQVDELLRAAFPAPVDQPDRFAELLKDTESAAVVRLVPNRRFAPSWIPAGAAIAAGVIGVMAGGMLTAGSAGLVSVTDGDVHVAGVVQSVLAHTPAGQVAYEQGFRVTPVLSFVANDGRPCREVRIDGHDAAARFVACRNTEQEAWDVEALVRSPVDDAPDAYRQAGAENDPVIGAAFARLGVKSTMDADAEREAIARGWTQGK